MCQRLKYAGAAGVVGGLYFSSNIFKIELVVTSALRENCELRVKLIDYISHSLVSSTDKLILRIVLW